MERRKKMTKTLISDSLKSLMLQHPFEKITIKMITNEAGVIRPTFYNYFCDKYEVLEWIFSEEIIDKVRSMYEQKMYSEGIKLLFVCMRNDDQFYKKAFEVSGQNSFQSIVEHYLYELFINSIEDDAAVIRTSNPLLDAQMIAHYYATGLADLLKVWIRGDMKKLTVDNMVEAYEFLLTHSFNDLIDQK